jgi:DNA invertase Pin-like site-specific DNA recombinase
MKRCALYARVSTADQNPALQLEEMRRYAVDRGFEITHEYVDQVSGDPRKPRHAPEYVELMRAASGPRRFDVVLVWKFDRLARSLGALIQALETFASHGIDFISCTQQIDTTTPAGRLFFHVVGAFAEFEREIIVERVRAGISSARARGKRWGRPRDHELEKRVLEFRAERRSLREISRMVRRSYAGVRRILERNMGKP